MPTNKIIQTFIKQNKKWVILLGVVIGCSVITSLIPPLVLERIVNRLGAQRSISFLLALSYFLCVVLADISESLQNACITIFGQKMTHAIRWALCQKLSRLSPQYLHAQPVKLHPSLPMMEMPLMFCIAMES